MSTKSSKRKQQVKKIYRNLSIKEKIAYVIAKEDSQSSFDITKSIGFLS